MPAGLRAHVRYPELMLKLQAAVYGLYHMTEPEVFYNREDLWSVASEVGLNDQRVRESNTLSLTSRKLAHFRRRLCDAELCKDDLCVRLDLPCPGRFNLSSKLS